MQPTDEHLDAAIDDAKRTEEEREARKRDAQEQLKLYKLKQQLRTEKLARKELLRELKLSEERVELLAATQVAEVEIPPIEVPKVRKKGTKVAATVSMCSDWHVEQNVDPIKVDGLNEFNLEIAERRIDRLITLTIDQYHRDSKQHKILQTVLAFLGDLISGYIHEELKERNYLAPAPAMIFVQRKARQFIETLKVETAIERIDVPCVSGNHDRSTKKKRIDSGPENSFAWMMYQTLAEIYQGDPRVNIHAPAANTIYQMIFGRRWRLVHLDQCNYKSGVGGVGVPVLRKVNKWNETRNAYMTIGGHFHEANFLAGHTIINNCLVGYDSFAEWIGARYSAPAQLNLLVTPEEGLMGIRSLQLDKDMREVA